MSKIVCYLYDCDAREILSENGIDLDELNIPKAEYIVGILGNPVTSFPLNSIQYQLNWYEVDDAHYYIFVEISE